MMRSIHAPPGQTGDVIYVWIVSRVRHEDPSICVFTPAAEQEVVLQAVSFYANTALTVSSAAPS